jgi:hypothetical protein
MTDPKYFDRERCDAEEEDAVVADAEAEFGAGRLKFNDVASAGGEVVIDSLKNAHRRFPVYRPEIGLGGGRPYDDLLVWHLAADAVFAQQILMCDPFTALDGAVGVVQFRGLGGGDWFRVNRSAGEGTGDRVGEDFQEMGYSRKLARVKLVEHLMGVFFHIFYLLFRRYSAMTLSMRERLTRESIRTSNAVWSLSVSESTF